jgi:hypothetical protein
MQKSTLKITLHVVARRHDQAALPKGSDRRAQSGMRVWLVTQKHHECHHFVAGDTKKITSSKNHNKLSGIFSFDPFLGLPILGIFLFQAENIRNHLNFRQNGMLKPCLRFKPRARASVVKKCHMSNIDP